MILVTGATGSLGSSLTKHLVETGERVAIFRRQNDPLSNLRGYVDDVEHRIGDVRDAASVHVALKGIRHLYHLAGIAVPFRRLRDEMQAVNVGGTGIVMAAAKARGVERVVFTSSSAAIGIPEDGKVADEDHPYNGDAFSFAYMHSKHQAEAIALRHARDGMDVVVVNPTGVIAPGGHPRASWGGAIAAINTGLLPFFPSGGIGLLARHDVVDGHIKAMRVGKSGHRYILNTVNLTYRELVCTIADVIGVKPPRMQIPDAVISVVGWVNSAIDLFRRDPMTCSPLAHDNTVLLVRKIYYDQSKALKELNLSQTSIRTAIEEVFTWWTRQSTSGLRG